MSKSKIVVVIPTIREAQYKSFIAAWEQLFIKHKITLVTVWDGETPHVEIFNYDNKEVLNIDYTQTLYTTHKNLIYRYTDACRNLGFIVAAHLQPDYVLTLDDDVAPLTSIEWDQHKASGSHMPYSIKSNDPIQSHLDVLQKKVPLGWMNTAHDTEIYLRGVPYGIRNEAPVMLSHGLWVGTPDFDGETQLKLERCFSCDGAGWVGKQEIGTYRECPKCAGKGNQTVPYSLPYYVGPIPRGVLFPLCGMNVMVRKEALPYLYFAPMGVDTKIGEKCKMCLGGCVPTDRDDNTCEVCKGTSIKPTLNRFSDIWMGVSLKKEFDKLGWACYTGGSTILHTRASDSKKNFEQEKLGKEWNEYIEKYIEDIPPDGKGIKTEYFFMYQEKREQFKELIEGILPKK